MAQYLDKSAILARLTDFHEETVNSPWLGGDVLIRELTAGERMSAQEACTYTDESGAPQFNGTYHRGMLLQMMIVDPNTGEPFADGRRDPRTGAIQIDPRTRTPLFTSDEITILIEGREGPVNALIDRGLRLSRLLPDAFRDRAAPPNGSERNAGSGAEVEPADSIDDAQRPIDATDERTSYDGQTLRDDGDAVGDIVALAVE